MILAVLYLLPCFEALKIQQSEMKDLTLLDTITSAPGTTECSGWSWKEARYEKGDDSAWADYMCAAQVTGGTQAACRLTCESWWQQAINAYGFSDGNGPYVYQSGPTSDPWKYSRAHCAWTPNWGASCTSCFVRSDKQTIDSTHGCYRIDYAGSSWRAEGLSQFCAHTEMGGDPHVTNLKGENFDILQVGVFKMLSISESLSVERIPGDVPKNLLQLDIEIDRVGQECSEAYIRKVSITGEWVSEMYSGAKLLEVRATSKMIEVSLDGQWTSVKNETGLMNISGGRISSASPKYAGIHLKEIAVNIDIDNYNKKQNHDYQAKVRDLGWSFLNLQFIGLKDLYQEKSKKIEGLLAEDDYTSVAKIPEDCEQFYESSSTTPFLSSVKYYHH